MPCWDLNVFKKGGFVFSCIDMSQFDMKLTISQNLLQVEEGTNFLSLF